MELIFYDFSEISYKLCEMDHTFEALHLTIRLIEYYDQSNE